MCAQVLAAIDSTKASGGAMFAEAKKRGNVDGLEFTGPAIRAVAERIAREKVGKANAIAATAALNTAVAAAEATTGGAAATTGGAAAILPAGGRGRGGRGSRGGRASGRVAGHGAGRASWKTKAAMLAEAHQASQLTNSALLARIALLESNQPLVPLPIPGTPPTLVQLHQPPALIPPPLII